MRLLHAVHDFLPAHQAGAELYVLHLARELSRRGHEVVVLCAEAGPRREHGRLRRRSHEGLPVLELVNAGSAGGFRATYRPSDLAAPLAEALAEARPEVVHLHGLLGLSFELPALARSRGARCVATLHDHGLFCPSGGQRFHERESHVCEEIDADRCARCFGEWRARRRPLRDRLFSSERPVSPAEIHVRLDEARALADQVDVFVSPSEALASDAVRFGLPRGKVRVSRYGLPYRGRRPRSRAARLRIGFAGTLAPHKGAHVLIEAAAGLPPGSFELHLFGDLTWFPGYVAELRTRARGLPVSFEGAFGNARAAEVYASLDVLVVPSLWPENSPLVIQEAFQAGVPVVASRTGGIPELVEDGVSGLLVTPGSVDELAAALRRVVSEPGLCARLAAGAPAVKSIEEDAGEWEARYRAVG